MWEILPKDYPKGTLMRKLTWASSLRESNIVGAAAQRTYDTDFGNI